MYWDLSEIEVFTVKDMYEQSLKDNKPLLSSYPGTWWSNYIANKEHFDRLFKKEFTSWYPMGQDLTVDDVEDITDEFRADCYAWLLANDKRYSEMYRIATIDDTSYDLLNNYDMTETFTGSTNESGSFIKGSETDSQSNSYTHGATSKAVNDSIEYGATSKSGSDQMAYGAMSKSGSDSTQYGATSESGSDQMAYGAQTIETDYTNTLGAHTDTATHSKSAFNESSYSPVSQDSNVVGQQVNALDEEVVNGAHTDNRTTSKTTTQHTDARTTSENTPAHTDTRTTSESETKHTDARTIGESTTSFTDSESKSATLGSRTDTDSKTGQEAHTLHRVGNIGVQTATDMMEKAGKFWGLFEFYTFIMKEIARELLRGC